MYSLKFSTSAERKAELRRYLREPFVPKTKWKHISGAVAKIYLASVRKREDGWSKVYDLKVDVGGKMLSGKGIAKSFRRFAETKQDGRCCYCMGILKNNAYAKPIEHILPRASYPQYSLCFWNLAVSCVDCNLIKSKAVWGNFAPAAKFYPSPEEFADLFHPTFHVHTEHVFTRRYDNGVAAIPVFYGLTTQGKNLCRDLLAQVAKKEVRLSNCPELHAALGDLEAYLATHEQPEKSAVDRFLIALREAVG